MPSKIGGSSRVMGVTVDKDASLDHCGCCADGDDTVVGQKRGAGNLGTVRSGHMAPTFSDLWPILTCTT